MTPAPVALFVYNRPNHTKKTIDALRANALASETPIYIFSDAAKNETASPNVQQVRDYIHSIENLSYFKSVTIIEALQNKGLASSIISGVSHVLSIHHRIIVLEDDLITSPYFLTYMNGALDYYQNESSIGSISAFTCPVKALKKYPYDVYLDPKGECWGWATWEDRWISTDWEVKDFDAFITSPRLQREFNQLQYNLTDMLKDQMTGKINSWAVRWVYSLFQRKLLTVYPSQTFVNNEGFDGSGTHCLAKQNHCATEVSQLLSYFPKSFQYEMPVLNKKIIHQVSIYEKESFRVKLNRKLKKIFKKIF